ncbi:MAG TPA: hypothetical protein DCK98_13135 [Chloroflexi bacterium]|nr:hypothetical protein [Chloroflexota bacterium]HAL26153.1 hypothetical protein [Chloroflexota bacterium]
MVFPCGMREHATTDQRVSRSASPLRMTFETRRDRRDGRLAATESVRSRRRTCALDDRPAGWLDPVDRIMP